MNPQTRPVRRKSHLSSNLPGFVQHTAFTRANAAKMYDPQELLNEPLSLGGSFMPDEVSREHSKRMHYAAYRMHTAKTRRELRKWKQHYLDLRDRIVVGNRKLIFRAVRGFAHGGQNLEEMASDCQIVLIHAVVAFNPWIGIRFSTYAYTCLLRALSRISKRASRDWSQRAVSLECFVEGEPVSRTSYPSSTANQHPVEEFLRADHPLLSEREKMVITRRFNMNEYSECTTLEQVGAELGLSKERVRQVQAAAITKLRRALSINP